MTNDPRNSVPNDPVPASPSDGGRPAWVGPLVGILVLAVVGFAGVQAWKYMRPAETGQAKTTPPASAPGRPVFTLTGTVSRTGKDGQKVMPKDATVAILQPAWTPEDQQEWERRTNEMVAKACKELGGEAPPTVTADLDSVRKADQAIAGRQQAGKPATPWKHQCTREYLTFLKANAVEAGRAAAGADGAYSVTVPPPAGVPYIVHAKSGDGEWVSKLQGRSNRLDLDDSKLVSE